ncbi:hypothetical protein L228DRAFT_106134 [Xylona heveae TC161]|uniref:CCHC-type domain-containing protein n=1 Tax=Xylona heveae (strain CBS 132557 / TC161) TaxID=1328760 RepID=A0A165HA18_XYLHT|nr:hypothetical protein L228DRAFT_106134 [Xylona heveae TC161]KZF23196.1 hypothetical protein L228DRAFT_106134 [Xylona heveae TC161]
MATSTHSSQQSFPIASGSPPSGEAFHQHPTKSNPYATPPSPQTSGYQSFSHGQRNSGQQAVAGSQSCFNCGAPDHWAQFCPEPRRAVPFGAVNQSNVPRPPKHRKFSAPSFAQHPVPYYGYPPQYGPHYGSAYPTAMPHAYPQAAPYAVPPTPISAHGQEPPQWPQQPSSYYHGAFTAGQSYPVGPYGPPTPATPSEHQHQSPWSTHGPPIHPNAFPHSTHQPSQATDVLTNPINSSGQARMMHGSDRSSVTSHQEPHHSISSSSGNSASSHSVSVEPRPGSGERYICTPVSASQIEHPAANSEPAVDSEIFDLEWEQTLFDSARQIQNRIVNPARAVNITMPGSLIEMEDDLEPYLLEPRSSSAEDSCLSRLIREVAKAGFPSFKETPSWQDRSDDPIFFIFPDVDEFIPLSAFRAFHGMYGYQKEPEKHYEESECHYVSSPSPQTPNEFATVREVKNDDAHLFQNCSTPSDEGKQVDEPLDSRNEAKYQHGREGTPPCEESRLSPQGYDTEGDQDWEFSRHHVRPERKPFMGNMRAASRPSRFSESCRRETQLHDRKPLNLANRRFSDDRYNSRSYRSRVKRSPPRHDRYHRVPNGEKLPPRKASFSTNSGPPKRRYSHARRYEDSLDKFDEGSPPLRRHSLEGGPPSTKRKLSHGHNGVASRAERSPPPSSARKRSYDQRDEPDARPDKPIRQEDDVTPRLKKRQPKVAEAFSRRW